MSLQAASRDFTPQFGTDFDMLVTPTMAITPPEVGWIWQGPTPTRGAAGERHPHGRLHAMST